MNNESFDDFDDDEFDYGPSKSQVKRECHALQDLGTSLTDLTKSELADCPISDSLRTALDQLKQIKSRPALKRQRQYIGRLMRSEDHESIQSYVDKIRQAHDRDTRLFHRYETMRDDLVTNGDAAISSALELHPSLERSRLRQLIRKAQKPVKPGQRNSGARELFRYLWENRNIETDEE